MTGEQAPFSRESPLYEEYAISYFETLCKKQIDELGGVSAPEYSLQHGMVATAIQKLAKAKGWELKRGYKTCLQDLPVKVTFDVVKKYHQEGNDAQ